MKKKDAYYFSHDSNAKDDPKCMVLIDQLGLEGYGIYWVLVEILRDQPGYKYPISLVPIIARRYNTTAEKMMTVVEKYGLFYIDKEDNFLSFSLLERMKPLEKAREQRVLAGKASGKSRRVNSSLNDCSTTVQRESNEAEQSKVKESKVIKEQESKEWNTDLENDFYKAVYLYGKRTHLVEAMYQWSALTQSEIKEIFDHIPLFVENHKQNDQFKYLPKFSEYLRLRRWNEDLPYEQQTYEEDTLSKIEKEEANAIK